VGLRWRRVNSYSSLFLVGRAQWQLSKRCGVGGEGNSGKISIPFLVLDRVSVVDWGVSSVGGVTDGHIEGVQRASR
jgi:hypothetical protein